ncbi:MAG: hypothetical protein A2Y33_16050 [Spirochaetes bacterium GWF1_51_8]|nr:MAG: hypothetical protein A2Y33_16050 [Spirochaetes bacterium GWF1_51_8]
MKIMRSFIPLSILAVLTFVACQSETVPDKTGLIGNEPAKPAADKPFRVEEGQTKIYGGMEIKIERIVEAFFQTEKGFSEQTQVDVTIKKDGKTVNWDAVYGSATNIFGYEIKVKDCATGTSDWRSFADFLFIKK